MPFTSLFACFFFWPVLTNEIAIVLCWVKSLFVGQIFQNHKFCKHFGLALHLNCKLILCFISPVCVRFYVFSCSCLGLPFNSLTQSFVPNFCVGLFLMWFSEFGALFQVFLG